MLGDQQTRLHFSTEKVIHHIVSTMTHDCDMTKEANQPK